MDSPTGYRRWLIGLIISLLGAGSSIIYATYATGQNVKQIEINTTNIEKLDKRSEAAATKDDVNRLERAIDRANDKLDRLGDRKK